MEFLFVLVHLAMKTEETAHSGEVGELFANLAGEEAEEAVAVEGPHRDAARHSPPAAIVVMIPRTLRMLKCVAEYVVKRVLRC